MSVSARSLLIPGMVLATAGTMVLTPVAAPALPVPAVPAVHVDEIALAGMGREIYDLITDFVQYTVESAQFWIDLIPVIGPPLADQLGIVYFQGIQPLIASTVYYVSDIIANPLNFVGLTVDYGSNVFYTGYNFVSAEAQYIGLPGLPPIPTPPPLASVAAPSRGAAAPEAPEAPEATVAAVRPEVRGRATRGAAAQTARPAAARAAASTDTETATDAPAASPKHQSTRAARAAARSGAAG